MLALDVPAYPTYRRRSPRAHRLLQELFSPPSRTTFCASVPRFSHRESTLVLLIKCPSTNLAKPAKLYPLRKSAIGCNRNRGDTNPVPPNPRSYTMKDRFKKLYRMAKYAVPVLYTLLLCAQIPHAYMTLSEHVQEVRATMQ